MSHLRSIVACLFASGFICAASATETGNILGEIGFVDEETGVTVESIERGEMSGEYRVLISMPRKGDSPPMEIEEILVTAPALKSKDVAPPARYEFVEDYSEDRYGFYVYIGKSREWPFRIFFNDHDSDLIHNH
jgi:hypothetical protein